MKDVSELYKKARSSRIGFLRSKKSTGMTLAFQRKNRRGEYSVRITIRSELRNKMRLNKGDFLSPIIDSEDYIIALRISEEGPFKVGKNGQFTFTLYEEVFHWFNEKMYSEKTVAEVEPIECSMGYIKFKIPSPDKFIPYGKGSL